MATIKTRANTAEQRIRDLLVKGPLKSGDLIEGLDHDLMNLSLSLAIGDGQSHWETGPERETLAELVANGGVTWGRDEADDVWYWLTKDSRPVVSALIQRIMRGHKIRLGRERYMDEIERVAKADAEIYETEREGLTLGLDLDGNLDYMMPTLCLDGDTLELWDYLDPGICSGDVMHKWKPPPKLPQTALTYTKKHWKEW